MLDGTIDLNYFNAKDNLADLFIKALKHCCLATFKTSWHLYHIQNLRGGVLQACVFLCVYVCNGVYMYDVWECTNVYVYVCR